MRKIAIIILSIIALISIDFLSKQYAVSSLAIGDVSIFGEWIRLQLSYNSGIAFSLPLTGLPLQIITIALICGLLRYYLHTEYSKGSKLIDAGYILIISGALSHGYERIWVGHVVDFIAVQYFAIFNFADIFISIGACILFFAYYVRKL